MEPQSADELRIPKYTLEGLEQLEQELRHGIMVHIPLMQNAAGEWGNTLPIPKDKLGVNMYAYTMGFPCGTIHCIHGWLRERDQHPDCEQPNAYHNLCHPRHLSMSADQLWPSITTEEMADAIFNYRHHGRAKWDEIFDRRPA